MSLTRQSYLDAIKKAKDKYSEQYPRAGVVEGLLTNVRHSGANNPILDSLDAKLEKTKSIDEVKDVIMRHFSQNNSWDAHSFNYYLLDELVKAFPNDKWERFDPKPVIYFHGKVFIASTVDPVKAFVHGLQEATPSNVITDYLSCKAGLYGSTVKEKAVKDGLPGWRPTNLLSNSNPPTCWIYEVKYRGSAAVDVEKTKHVRGGYWDKISPDHHRVNIKGLIKPEDIIGAEKYQRKDGKVAKVGDQQLNEAYQPERPEESQVLTQELFTPRLGV